MMAPDVQVTYHYAQSVEKVKMREGETSGGISGHEKGQN